MVAFSESAYEDFLAADDNTPVVMLNLLRFDPNGGRERYFDYLHRAKPILERFGAAIIFAGRGLPALTEGDNLGWDFIVLVQYPQRSVFNHMVQDAQYQAVFQIGASAIADIVLQPMKPESAVV